MFHKPPQGSGEIQLSDANKAGSQRYEEEEAGVSGARTVLWHAVCHTNYAVNRLAERK